MVVSYTYDVEKMVIIKLYNVENMVPIKQKEMIDNV